MNGDPVTGPEDETASSSPTSAGSSAPPSPRGADPAERLTIGNRVVVRYRLEEGQDASATDVTGELIARNNDFLIVEARTATGTERIKLIRQDIIAAKDIPPRASRPGPAHQRISADDLELVMAKGWVPVEGAGLGSWLLRSSDGFTGRANSVLPVGDPTLPLERAIDYCETWYSDRDRPVLFQVHGEPGFDVAAHPVAAALIERGYAVGAGRPDWQRVKVMTGLTAEVPPLTVQSPPVVADAKLDPEWIMTYGEQRRIVPGVTEAVLSGSEGQLFLSVRDEATRRLIGIARMAIHPGWAGIFSVWVHPDHRRKGIATAMTSAIAMVARDNNMPAIYLQVSGDNAEAIAFYEHLGFGLHHEYTYLAKAPGADA